MAGKSVHVVLGSGGARVISYVGALEALRDAQYEVASFSTSSAGTLIGALLAGGLSLDELRDRILDLDFKAHAGERRWLPAIMAWPYSAYSRSGLPKLLTELLGKDPQFSELTIPLATIALDIISRSMLVYSETTHPDMLVSEALEIAVSLPGMYPPHERHGRILIDGGVASALPVWLASRHQDTRPIVVLSSRGNMETARPSSFPEYLARIIESGIAGRDDILIQQVRRATRIDIFCGDVAHDDLGLGIEKKRFLLEAGRRAVQRALAQGLASASAPSPSQRAKDNDDRAESYAAQITNYFFQGETHLGHVIQTGDRSVVNVESTLNNVKQVIGDSNNFNEEQRGEFSSLVDQLRVELKTLAQSHTEEAELLSQRLSELVALADRPERKTSLLNISAKGLKDAAEALADIAPSVLAMAGKIATFVLGLG